jgi:hypothetical protein
MSRDISSSLTIPPPITSVDTIIIASSTSVARCMIPENWRNSWITIMADGCDVYLAFSYSVAATVDITAVTTITSSAVASHGTGECVKLLNGTSMHFDMSKAGRKNAPLYLVHDESAASAFVRITRSSGQVSQA